eukprot:m.1006247 g.1006247  ORF g.1006247 m.1006247 type:complete len:390 (-) comp24053_c2_seq16:1953-3122(-)
MHEYMLSQRYRAHNSHRNYNGLRIHSTKDFLNEYGLRACGGNYAANVTTGFLDINAPWIPLYIARQEPNLTHRHTRWDCRASARSYDLREPRRQKRLLFPLLLARSRCVDAAMRASYQATSVDPVIASVVGGWLACCARWRRCRYATAGSPGSDRSSDVTEGTESLLPMRSCRCPPLDEATTCALAMLALCGEDWLADTPTGSAVLAQNLSTSACVSESLEFVTGSSAVFWCAAGDAVGEGLSTAPVHAVPRPTVSATVSAHGASSPSAPPPLSEGVRRVSSTAECVDVATLVGSNPVVDVVDSGATSAAESTSNNGRSMFTCGVCGCSHLSASAKIRLVSSSVSACESLWRSSVRAVSRAGGGDGVKVAALRISSSGSGMRTPRHRSY